MEELMEWVLENHQEHATTTVQTVTYGGMTFQVMDNGTVVNSDGEVVSTEGMEGLQKHIEEHHRY